MMTAERSSPCPVCSDDVDPHHNFDLTMTSGLVLGPVCSSECAHTLYLLYHATFRTFTTPDQDTKDVC